MKNGIFILLTALVFHVSGQTPEQAIREVMAAQERCWNDGDLVCFMDGYWESEKLVFIGSRGLTYGWETTLKNYQESYPDKAAMGRLKFTIKEIEPLSDDYWFVIGQWQLFRESSDLEGHYSLLWRFIEGEWKIVADHSS